MRRHEGEWRAATQAACWHKPRPAADSLYILKRWPNSLHTPPLMKPLMSLVKKKKKKILANPLVFRASTHLALLIKNHFFFFIFSSFFFLFVHERLFKAVKASLKCKSRRTALNLASSYNCGSEESSQCDSRVFKRCVMRVCFFFFFLKLIRLLHVALERKLQHFKSHMF